MNHFVSAYMGMVGVETSTASSVLASEDSLEATLHVVGGMVTKKD